MTTTPTLLSSNPLQIQWVTDQQMLELKGTVSLTVGGDNVAFPYDVVEQVHVPAVGDPAHAWTVISNDKKAPQSTIVIQY